MAVVLLLRHYIAAAAAVFGRPMRGRSITVSDCMNFIVPAYLSVSFCDRRPLLLLQMMFLILLFISTDVISFVVIVIVIVVIVVLYCCRRRCNFLFSLFAASVGS